MGDTVLFITRESDDFGSLHLQHVASLGTKQDKKYNICMHVVTMIEISIFIPCCTMYILASIILYAINNTKHQALYGININVDAEIRQNSDT